MKTFYKIGDIVLLPYRYTEFYGVNFGKIIQICLNSRGRASYLVNIQCETYEDNRWILECHLRGKI